ncbi:hypothetical protein PR003_g10819 [Phytophthora rubi]|uniref:Wilms tumor protein homolog n=1 Tax=Phytophthora rubi TaxID=129364 RepID=A0A6A4FIJ5_9STRA|nr:hypothetical protein PR001_g10313 [Phytophthora rubi]KAE9339805.1 hypothetical protein PR003_g10819 [Phytophthora rubi]
MAIGRVESISGAALVDGGSDIRFAAAATAGPGPEWVPFASHARRVVYPSRNPEFGDAASWLPVTTSGRRAGCSESESDRIILRLAAAQAARSESTPPPPSSAMMSLLAQPLSPRSSSRLVFGAFELPTAAAALGSPTSSSSSNDKDRPFVCEEPGCGRRFNRKFTLSEHKKTHTGEKPYVCPLAECSRRFSTSGNLARHKRLHASLKPFECDINGCKRSFPSQEKLDHHIKIHTGRRTHMCRVTGCTKTFSTAGNLTRHIKNRHPELVRTVTTYPSYQYPLHRPEAPNGIHTQSLSIANVRHDMPSPHMLVKLEPVPPVFSPDSVELASFQDELSAFQMDCEHPVQPFASRPQDLTPPESNPQSLSEIARCSMGVLDEVIEFELTKNV